MHREGAESAGAEREGQRETEDIWNTISTLLLISVMKAKKRGKKVPHSTR
jgi:hypothetical protein